MRDAAAQPLEVRLHNLIGRLSREGGYIVEQGDIAEGVARLVQLERALGDLFEHVGDVEYRDPSGKRLEDAVSAVFAAAVLGRPSRSE